MGLRGGAWRPLLGVDTVTIFSCTTCGSHAFRLSAGMKQAYCEDCNSSLGSWQTLRAKIKQNLHASQCGERAPVKWSAPRLS